MAQMPNSHEKRTRSGCQKKESLRVQHTLNVQLAVKQTTQQNSVGKAQVRIYVPRGTDHEKKTEETEQTTKKLLISKEPDSKN